MATIPLTPKTKNKTIFILQEREMQSAIGIQKIRITQFGGIQKAVKDEKGLKCFEG